MKNLILTAILVLFPAGVFADAVSEAGFAGELNAIAVIAAGNIKADKSDPVRSVIAEPVKAGSNVRVSGYVTLYGNAFVPQNGGYSSVNMTGWAVFRDATGKISSNSTYVNIMASAWIRPGQYVSQTVRPNLYVQLYRGGKYVGSANVSGNINVSGWPSGGYIRMNGSGNLDGNFYAEDEISLTAPVRLADNSTVLKKMPLLDLLAERNATAKVIDLAGTSFLASISVDDNWDVYFQLKQAGSYSNPGIWKRDELKDGVIFKYSSGELSIKGENDDITLTDMHGLEVKTSSAELFDLLYSGSSNITFNKLVTYAVIRNLAPLSGNEGTITMRIGSDGLYYYSLTPDKQVADFPRWLLSIDQVLYGLKVTDSDVVFLSKPSVRKPFDQERLLKF